MQEIQTGLEPIEEDPMGRIAMMMLGGVALLGPAACAGKAPIASDAPANMTWPPLERIADA